MTPETIEHARWTADLMDVQPNDHVLEVGFGTGANIGLLAELASSDHVAGAEISKTAIEMASRRNVQTIAEGRVAPHRASGGAVPFDGGTFDKACTVATACVIADPGALLKEMHRVSQARRAGGGDVPDS